MPLSMSMPAEPAGNPEAIHHQQCSGGWCRPLSLLWGTIRDANPSQPSRLLVLPAVECNVARWTIAVSAPNG